MKRPVEWEVRPGIDWPKLAAIIGLISFAALGQQPEESPAAAAPAISSSPAASAPATTSAPAATEVPEAPRQAVRPKRGFFGRILHPFGGSAPAAPETVNPRLRGLALELQVSPQPVKLSEVRQLDVKVIVTNNGKKGVNLEFPNEQRIEIYLLNSAEVVLARWSENRVFKDKPGTLLINPQEHAEYNEKIATRELAPGKVYIAEAFFPKYPELKVRQKFLTEQ